MAAGEGAPVVRGDGSWAPELHQATMKMRTWSREAMHGGRGGSTTSSSSLELITVFGRLKLE